MQICTNCGDKIPWVTEVNGEKKHLGRRKRCLKCNPLGTRNFWGDKKIVGSENGIRKLEKREFFCKICKNPFKHKTRNRVCTSCRKRNKKEAIVKEFGGCCSVCGYDKCLEVLSFHHKDKNKKEKNIARLWHNSNKSLRKELEKCQLVCANCHGEIHQKEREWRN